MSASVVGSATDHKKLGIDMLTKGQNDQALFSFNTALGIETRELGERHPTVASTKITIGVILQSQGNHEDALKKYDEAFDVLEKDHSHKSALGVIHLNRGSCYLSLGNFEKALACYKLAIACKQEVHGEAHVEVLNASFTTLLIFFCCFL